MFGGNSSLAKKGPHAIAVPGEFAGYIGARDAEPSNITWERIMRPTINMCR